MTKFKTARGAMILGLAGALALTSAAGAAERKKWREVLEITAPTTTDTSPAGKRLEAELATTAGLGNKYLDASRDNRTWDRATGGLMLLSAFYGAAVTAFNPAPKNLQAAILATGTFGGLNVGLNFRARSVAHRQGHRAMACLVQTAAPLMTYEQEYLGTIEDLRQEAADALATADLALIEDAKTKAPAPPAGKGLEAKVDALLTRLDGKAEDEERKALEERMKVLAGLDRTLGEEQGAYAGSGARVAQVRRGIQDVVDKALDSAAPDYAAAAKAMGETAAPEPAPSGTATAGGGGAAPAGAKMAFAPGVGLNPPTIAQALAEVNTAIRRLEARSPSEATKAYKAMGDCIPKAA